RHDFLEILHGIEVEPERNAESRTHGRREHPESRRGADERESLDRHRDRLRLGPFREPDVYPVVLHGGIEELLDDGTQAMDFVNEEHVAGAHVRERANEIARLLERRARGGVNVHAHLACDELGERGLAEPGRAVEQRVIERLTARECGIDVNAEAFLELLLADEFSQPLRAQRQLDDGFIGERLRGRYFGTGHGGNLYRRNAECTQGRPATTRVRKGARQTFARSVASRSAARASVSVFLQNANRTTRLPRSPSP